VCTVSIIPTPDGYRLVHNRDERRDRALGEPPAWRWFELDGTGGGTKIEALAPRDPAAGGTWLATTRSGITAAVLNLNPPRAVRAELLADQPGGAADGWLAAPPGFKGSKSRGIAILELLAGVEAGRDPAEVSAEAFSGTRPCRSVLVVPRTGPGGEDIVEIVTRPHAPEAFVHPPAGKAGRFVLGADSPAMCWVSSGLGDDVVEPRIPLFDEMVLPEPTAAIQDAYHRHRWDDHPEQSVRMSRSDARTVSITAVEVDGSGPRATHEDIPEDVPASVE
jgi:hypothetical protein